MPTANLDNRKNSRTAPDSRATEAALRAALRSSPHRAEALDAVCSRCGESTELGVCPECGDEYLVREPNPAAESTIRAWWSGELAEEARAHEWTAFEIGDLLCTAIEENEIPWLAIEEIARLAEELTTR